MPQAQAYWPTHYTLPDERRGRRNGNARNQPHRQPSSRHGYPFLILVLAILFVGYVAGIFYYRSHMLPGSTLAGRDVSLMDEEALSSALAEDASGFSVSVRDAEGTDAFTIDSTDVGYSFDAGTAAQSLLSSQPAFAWPSRSVSGALLQRDHAVSPQDGSSWDQDALSDAVADAVATYNETSATPAQDAKLVYDGSQQSFVVTPETAGTQLDAAAAQQAVSGAMQTLQDEVTLSSDAYLQPNVHADDERLSAAIPAANALMGASITVTMDGKTIATPDDHIVAQWIQLDDSFQPTLTEEGIEQWAEDNYDTVGTTRTFTDYLGRTRTVVCNDNPNTQSTYGQEVDSATFAKEAYEAATGKETATIDLPVTQEAAGFTEAGAQDWGDRYIDVDITNQHAALVDNGSVLWESDTVTGNVSAGNSTPEGIFQITNKFNSITLMGEDASQNFVYNWMGFIRSTWGLHDATWRTEFGGDIYLTNGSHGCVNLPLEKANELYPLVQVGDVVVVHE